jgi:hypothetical protein
MPDPNGPHAATCECEGSGENITYEESSAEEVVHQEHPDQVQIEDHVMPLHVAGGAENEGAATFLPGLSDMDSLLDLASNSGRFIGRVQEATGRVRWVIDMGMQIGTNGDGSATSILTIVRERAGWAAGDLVTMHPGLPRDLSLPFAR